MSVANQLYQLQEVDTELDSREKTVAQITRLLVDNKAVTEAQANLDSGRLNLAGLTKELRSVETDIADLTAKITAIDKKLYGGKVGNPKELTDLSHESDGLKKQRSALEEKELGIMEQVEKATAIVTSLNADLTRLQSERQSQQVQLSADLEKAKAVIAELKQKRHQVVGGIDSQAVALYDDVKKQRGTAVARVEQGLCRGCRISLPVSEFQKAKKGELVKCGSCGRILFMS